MAFYLPNSSIFSHSKTFPHKLYVMHTWCHCLKISLCTLTWKSFIKLNLNRYWLLCRAMQIGDDIIIVLVVLWLSLQCGIHRWSRTKQGVFATLGFGCDLKIHHVSHTMVCVDVLVCLCICILHTLDNSKST